MPWDVLHQGLARWVPLSFGTVTIAVGVIVLLGWIPLRQRPGIGTVSNVLVIGVVVDTVAAVPGAAGRPAAARHLPRAGRRAQRGGDRPLHRGTPRPRPATAS